LDQLSRNEELQDKLCGPGYVEAGMWNDPEFLESLRKYALKLTVVDASTQTLALKLVSPDPAR
jgi:hypothetical protein